MREALASGLDVILRVDVQGAAIKRLLPQAVFIFLTTGSEVELVQRLSQRRTETPEFAFTHRHRARRNGASPNSITSHSSTMPISWRRLCRMLSVSFAPSIAACSNGWWRCELDAATCPATCGAAFTAVEAALDVCLSSGDQRNVCG
ncbi:MAG: hypothetical protein U0559_05435 [Anaerolineae bacterium]